MIGISEIGVHIPERRVSNLERLDEFTVTEEFVRDKIGVINRAMKEPDQKASDLCVKAFENLKSKKDFDLGQIDCCVVVTQNPDFNIPHTSAIVHGALGLPERCACFDISLGCSGYVYALSVVMGFMQSNGFTKALLFTADPYSQVVSPADKNTAMIFGDAASVTLLEEGGSLIPVGFEFGTRGKDYRQLINKDGALYMNGRAVFNFTATTIPPSIDGLLARLSLSKQDIIRWYFHQGSKYIVDTIKDRLGLSSEKVVFDMYEYGNTVSSSIPILLEAEMGDLKTDDKVVISGFGVGLSWASAVLKKS